MFQSLSCTILSVLPIRSFLYISRRLCLNTGSETEAFKQQLAQSLPWWQRKQSEVNAVVAGVALLNKHGFRNTWVPYVLSSKFHFTYKTKCVVSCIGKGTYNENLALLGLHSTPDQRKHGFLLVKRYRFKIWRNAAHKRMQRLWVVAAAKCK